MITFVAQLNVRDVANWVKALDRVLDRAHHWADRDGGELNRRCARDYSNAVLLAIYNQRFSYPSYNDRYATWKLKVGKGGEGFWKLKGDLARALTHFREDVGWKGGIPAEAMDSGGKSWFGNLDRGPRKPIAMYGIVMEFGGNFGRAGRHPARPLFWPVYKEFAVTEWPRAHWVALEDMGNHWR